MRQCARGADLKPAAAGNLHRGREWDFRGAPRERGRVRKVLRESHTSTREVFVGRIHSWCLNLQQPGAVRTMKCASRSPRGYGYRDLRGENPTTPTPDKYP